MWILRKVICGLQAAGWIILCFIDTGWPNRSHDQIHNSRLSMSVCLFVSLTHRCNRTWTDNSVWWTPQPHYHNSWTSHRQGLFIFLSMFLHIFDVLHATFQITILTGWHRLVKWVWSRIFLLDLSSTRCRFVWMDW